MASIFALDGEMMFIIIDLLTHNKTLLLTSRMFYNKAYKSLEHTRCILLQAYRSGNRGRTMKHPIENLIYRYSSQFGTFLHQDREKLRSSTREYVLYVSW